MTIAMSEKKAGLGVEKRAYGLTIKSARDNIYKYGYADRRMTIVIK